MKINKKVLSIPPYISTAWERVKSIHLKGNSVVITLPYGETIAIPNLPGPTIEAIFTIHAAVIEEENQPNFDSKNDAKESPSRTEQIGPLFQAMLQSPNQPNETTIRFGIASLNGLTAAMAHDSALSATPDLPSEVIEKISAISKIVSAEELASIQPAEPHCNCPHCQITRALTSSGNDGEPALQAALTASDEEISDEELQFQQWHIEQSSEKLYTVSNKLDETEKYSVYLGEPVGCTCGRMGCDHILAVLKS